jgi:hypothetical protein
VGQPVVERDPDRRHRERAEQPWSRVVGPEVAESRRHQLGDGGLVPQVDLQRPRAEHGRRPRQRPELAHLAADGIESIAEIRERGDHGFAGRELGRLPSDGRRDQVQPVRRQALGDGVLFGAEVAEERGAADLRGGRDLFDGRSCQAVFGDGLGRRRGDTGPGGLLLAHGQAFARILP